MFETPQLEPQALADLYLSHGKLYRTLAFRYLGSPDDADDAVQVAFLRALEKGGQFRGDSPLANWMTIILKRECLSELRRRRARPTEEPLEDTHTITVQQPREAPPFDDRRAVVLRLQFRLSLGERRFLARVLAQEEIDMRVPANKAIRHRVLTKLRAAVARKSECPN